MKLFEPIAVGAWQLPNRIVMAAMTRSRATLPGIPTQLTVQYYAQRATAGLIVTEGIQPSSTGQGYLNTPGLYTTDQVRGWRRVTDAVHDRDGRIIAQLMHAGRVGHPSNRQGQPSVAPSALCAPGTVRTSQGLLPHALPHALDAEEAGRVADEFAVAARFAIAAGFDGVEIHAANGYLVHQFLSPASNVRTDRYGGSPEFRARFAIEVAAKVAGAIGGNRVGMRLSPGNQAKGVLEDDSAATAATYTHLVGALRGLKLAYLSVIGDPTAALVQRLRTQFGGPVMINSGSQWATDRDRATWLVSQNRADMVAVGRAFIANPDLVERWRTNAGVNEHDPETFYGGGSSGYTDYSTM
jgi:2,4-dienoyl-CoA reductase-like NADH-dependent reductase (Old Yellow Enzyme family)